MQLFGITRRDPNTSTKKAEDILKEYIKKNFKKEDWVDLEDIRKRLTKMYYKELKFQRSFRKYSETELAEESINFVNARYNESIKLFKQLSKC